MGYEEWKQLLIRLGEGTPEFIVPIIAVSTIISFVVGLGFVLFLCYNLILNWIRTKDEVKKRGLEIYKKQATRAMLIDAKQNLDVTQRKMEKDIENKKLNGEILGCCQYLLVKIYPAESARLACRIKAIEDEIAKLESKTPC